VKSTADVVIVGGGCMGASVAYHLARRGITDVVVLEREQMLATGSTGKNAGGVRHQFSNEANIRLSLESIGVLERFADEVGYPIDFHQDGYLFLLSSSASVETFTKNVALQRSLGVAVDWLDAAAAAQLAPGVDTDGVIGATFCQRDGIADPNGVTIGFAKAAQAAGAASRARYRGHRGPRRCRPRRRRRDDARHDCDANAGQRRRTVGAADRANGRRRRPRQAAAASHLYRRIRCLDRHSDGADVAHHGDRLRDHLLFPSRGPRTAVWNGRPEGGSRVSTRRCSGTFCRR
jgi:hypothetical protein